MRRITVVGGEKNQIIMVQNRIENRNDKINKNKKSGYLKRTILHPGDMVTICPERTIFLKRGCRKVLMVAIKIGAQTLNKSNPIFFIGSESLMRVPSKCVYIAEEKLPHKFYSIKKS